MKHPDLLKLKYDGRAMAEIKKLPVEAQEPILKAINFVASKIKNKFPDEKNVEHLKMAMMVHEFYYKKQRDKKIRQMIIAPIESYRDVDQLIEYLEAVNYIKGITTKVSIEYINPIKVNQVTKEKTQLKIEGLKDKPSKKISLNGKMLLNYIETIIRNNFKKDWLEIADKNLKNKHHVATFGELKANWKEFIAQYRKKACATIYDYLTPLVKVEQKRKVMTMYTLSVVKFIPSHEQYKKVKGKGAVSENTYYTRLYRDHTKISLKKQAK